MKSQIKAFLLLVLAAGVLAFMSVIIGSFCECSLADFPTSTSALEPTPSPTPQVEKKVVDKSGNTRFHYLVIEAADNISGFGDTLGEALKKWPRKDGSTLKVMKPCKWQEVIDEINKLKEKAEPGDEVVIAHLGHGGGGTELGVPDKDDTKEEEDFDNHIDISRENCKDQLTDDKLSEVLSGFKKSVTITVFFGSCFGGTFKDDLARSTNKDGEKYGDHLCVVGKPGEVDTLHVISLEEAVKDDDNNGLPDGDNAGDGVLTTDELQKFVDGFPDNDIGQAQMNGSLEESTCVLPVVNGVISFEPIKSTFKTTSNATGCPAGFVGKFSFSARLTSISDISLFDLIVVVQTLTNGNLLQNADGGPAGVGAILTVPEIGGFSDGLLSPEDFVDVPFVICLKNRNRFSLFVDVFGRTLDKGTNCCAFINRQTGQNGCAAAPGLTEAGCDSFGIRLEFVRDAQCKSPVPQEGRICVDP